MFDDELTNYQSNPFNDPYLYAVNRDTFNATGSDAVFHSHFQDRLFEKDRFYIIAGTDSGLLVNWIIRRGIPEGTRYLFVEDAKILAGFGNLPPEFDDRLAVCSVDDWERQAQALGVRRYTYHKRVTLERSLGVLSAFHSPYADLWRQLRGGVNAYCWRVGVIMSSHFQMRCRILNLTENLYPALPLRNAFPGKSALLLAGGPSLDGYLPWIREHQSDYLVVAVSRISNLLAESAITPDIIVSIDPYPLNLLVSKDMAAFQNQSLFINAAHVSPELLSLWDHRKAYLGERLPWKSAIDQDNIPALGHTVTNTAYTLLVEMGVQQIILLGVNLCFSKEGYTHATHSFEHEAGPKLMLGDQRVQTNGGEFADTNNGYFNAAQELERETGKAAAKGCVTVNPAPDAMRIPGILYQSLDTLTKPAAPEEPVSMTIARRLQFDDKSARRSYYLELAAEIERFTKELHSIEQLAASALKLNRQMYSDRHNNFGKLKSQLDNIERLLNTKHGDAADFVKKFGIRSFITIVRTDEDREWRGAEIEQSGKAYYQAYLDSCRDLLKLLEIVARRIGTRLLEDEDDADFLQLIKHWKADQQLPRALRWQRLHSGADFSEHQAQLEKFEQLLQTRLNQLETIHKDRQQHMRDLNGLPGKALALLNSKDAPALQSLLAGLEQHPDNPLALRTLIRAYLLELEDKDHEALAAYNAVNEPAFTFDILRRKLVLHLKANRHEKATKVLKALSEYTPAFLPYYADMLHMQGQTEMAVQVYADYLLTFSNDLQAMFKLGKIYQQMGLADGVDWTMNFILEHDPQNQAALSMLKQHGKTATPRSQLIK